MQKERSVMSTAVPQSMSDRTTIAIREVLDGRRHGLRTAALFAGPAVIASIAYMDPGNFATNIQAGARYGYTLLWVVLVANVIAMLFQALSAKLGIVTGSNLAEMCRDRFSPPVVIAMWIISEIAAMATDLAEFLGGAVGLSILFHLPLLAGMIVTGIVTYAILIIGGRGFRPMELMIGGLVSVIGLCYIGEMFIAPVDWASAGLHSVLPQIPDAAALTISVGIVGATVMPHAIYLHSGLTQGRAPARNDEERRKLLRFSNREVIIALALAGLVNMAMVAMASSAFHAGHSDVAEIETAYHTLTPLLGAGAAVVFLASLLASGISSSAVGTMAGQLIMQGFVGVRIPLWARRLATMVPAFVVVALGADATKALVLSQVVLSIALPAPMIALVLFTRRADIMGPFVNSRLMDVLAIVGSAFVIILNAVLLLQTFGISIPGLPSN
jgi:manganese transport protein